MRNFDTHCPRQPVNVARLRASGNTQLAEDWSLIYYADVGAGDSDLIWQVMLGANYQFTNVDVAFGYRHLAWEFDDDGLSVPGELEISGPYVGVIARF